MRLRSKGLGRKEMVMDFREYHVVRESDELVIVGVIRDPVTWDFSIRFCEDDYPAVMKLILNKNTIISVLRALFRPKKKHHWACDPEQHYAEGAKVKELIRPEIAARVKSAMTPFEEAKKKRRSDRITDADLDNDADLDADAA